VGKFLRYRKGKTFYERPFVSNLKTISKMSILPPPGKISVDSHAAHWCTVRDDLFFPSIVFPKQLGRVLAICLQILFNDWCQSHQNILCHLHIHGSVNMDFLLWQNLKANTRDFLELTTKCGCAWQRRNPVSILFVPENRHTQRINFLQATLFYSKCAANFFFLVRRKLKKFENHCSEVRKYSVPPDHLHNDHLHNDHLHNDHLHNDHLHNEISP